MIRGRATCRVDVARAHHQGQERRAERSWPARLASLRPADGDAAALARWQQHQEVLARWLEGPVAVYGELVGSLQRDAGARLRVVRRE